MASNPELVQCVIEVTGITYKQAEELLSLCDNDIQAAVAFFFEHGVPAIEAEEELRAPIAPIREQLIGPEHDNFHEAATSSTRHAYSTSRIKICPLRDFAREGAIMEEQLQAESVTGGRGTMRSKRQKKAYCESTTETQDNVTGSKAKRSCLGDLYRPPTDIAYAGKFQEARTCATEMKLWVLVNVQNDNFDSQVLNRDVWSDKELRENLKDKFMLWQVDSESLEGRRFISFYNCEKLPYVCIIDPRTGEEIWKCTEPSKIFIIDKLRKFRCNFIIPDGNDDGEIPTTSKRSMRRISENNINKLKKGAEVAELTEEEQIAIAIQNSIYENGSKEETEHNSNDTSNASKDIYNDTEDSSMDFPDEGSIEMANKEVTKLKLRLINAKGDDEVLNLCWPSDTKLKLLRRYMAKNYPYIAARSYKLVCAYPRKALEEQHDNNTLKEMGLYPNANLHVTFNE